MIQDNYLRRCRYRTESKKLMRLLLATVLDRIKHRRIAQGVLAVSANFSIIASIRGSVGWSYFSTLLTPR